MPFMDTPEDQPLKAVPTILLGIDVDDARLPGLLASYASVWAEICKLRDMDLADLQPAVVFRLRDTWNEVRSADA